VDIAPLHNNLKAALEAAKNGQCRIQVRIVKIMHSGLDSHWH
jgi:hypothetical protein